MSGQEETVNKQDPHGSFMNGKSILAEEYVPTQYREVNLVPVKWAVPSMSLPSLSLDKYQLPPMIPNFAPRAFPQFIWTPEDALYEKLFALEIYQQTLCRPHTWTRHPVFASFLRSRKYQFQYCDECETYDSFNHLGQVQHSKRPLPQIPIRDTSFSIENYISTFQILIDEERKTKLDMFERFSQYNVQISYNAEYCWLRIDGIVDAKPPVEPGDLVLLRPVQNTITQMEVEAFVIRTERTRSNGDRICFTSVPSNLAWIYSEHCNMRILPSPQSYISCQSALQWLKTVPSDVVDNLLFPTHDASQDVGFPGVPTVSSEDHDEYRDLSHDQRSFIELVLARTDTPETHRLRCPLILTGPAGTGKTCTLLAAILSVLEKPKTRILICAPSHTAANVITQRLSSKLNKDAMFRLLNADRPVSTIPVSILKFCCQNETTGGFALPNPEFLMKTRCIVCTCEDARILYQIGLTNEALRDQRDSWISFVRSQSVGMHVSMSHSTPYFTHLFMDEAAQALEPESLIPLSVVVDPEPGVTKVEIVLAGDPRQLSACVYSDVAAQAGLSRSWMERLLLNLSGNKDDNPEAMLGRRLDSMDELLSTAMGGEKYRQLTVFLTQNYRCHESLLMVPSVLFYYDRLQRAGYGDAEAIVNRKWCSVLRNIESISQPTQGCLQTKGEIKKQYSWPIHFCGVSGKDTSVTVRAGFTTDSWKNESEAKLVVNIVRELMASPGVSTSDVSVMSPFRGQVILIRQLLREIGASAVNVGTVEDFQAVESPVVVLSLTRSSAELAGNDMMNRLGMFGQPKRSNVALTRAQSLLIVVGDTNLMKSDQVWRHFLEFCFRNGLCYGDWDASKLLSEGSGRLGTLEKMLRN